MAEDIGPALAASLLGLESEFTANWLAYQSLTAKNETLLCGALAGCLHRTFEGLDDTQVRREWWNYASNGYFDIAVLRDGDPVALVEAKAAMSFDLVKAGTQVFPTKDMLKDIAKLRGVEFDGERYVVLFVTHPYQVPRRKWDPALPYIDGIRRHGAIDMGKIEQGFARLRESTGSLPVLARGRIAAGNAFGVDVVVLYWLLAISKQQ